MGLELAGLLILLAACMILLCMAFIIMRLLYLSCLRLNRIVESLEKERQQLLNNTSKNPNLDELLADHAQPKAYDSMRGLPNHVHSAAPGPRVVECIEALEDSAINKIRIAFTTGKDGASSVFYSSAQERFKRGRKTVYGHHADTCPGPQAPRQAAVQSPALMEGVSRCIQSHC